MNRERKIFKKVRQKYHDKARQEASKAKEGVFTCRVSISKISKAY